MLKDKIRCADHLSVINVIYYGFISQLTLIVKNKSHYISIDYHSLFFLWSLCVNLCKSTSYPRNYQGEMRCIVSIERESGAILT